MFMFETNHEFPLQQLFSKEIDAQIRIINAMYRNVQGYRIDDLAEELHLSNKTVYKYLRQINSLATVILSKEIFILCKEPTIYQFSGDKIDFLKLRYSIIETCYSIKMLKDLLSNSSIHIYNFCENNFISESAFKKHIYTLNLMLKDLNIKIKIRSNQIFLFGDEATIRYFMTSFFWRLYNGIKWPFENIDHNKIKKIEYIFFKSDASDISKGKQKIFLYFLAVSITRANSKFSVIPESLPPYTNELVSNTYLPPKISQYLKDLFFLEKLEINFILLLLYIFPEFYLPYKQIELTLNTIESNSPLTYGSIKNFINFCKKKHPKWNIKSEEGQKFISAVLASHIATALFKEAYFNIQDLDLVQYFSKNVPMLLPSIQDIVLKGNANLSITKQKSLVFRLTQSYIMSFPPSDFEPEVKILLISDSPMFIETEIIHKINSILRYKNNVVITTNAYAFQAPDLIIATASYTDDTYDAPTVYIFPQIDSRDANNIIRICKQISHKKRIQQTSIKTDLFN